MVLFSGPIIRKVSIDKGDDELLSLGSDDDIVLLHRSTTLAADAELTSVIEGTSDHPGVAANSLIISNITDDGDIMFAVSDNGNSIGLLKLNGADGTLEVHGNLLPTADDTYDLGSATAAWKDLFIEGNITLSDAGTVATSAGALTITSAAAATWSTSAGALTFTSAAAATWSTSAGILTIDGDDGIVLNTTGSGDLQINENILVGADDTGYDVKFFGDSAGAYMEYDQSEDQLRIMGASADATTSTGKLLLATSLTDINANDVIGRIDFQSPHEGGGGDSTAILASIQAIAQGTFSSSVNATDLIFYTGHSEAATEKFRFTSEGEIGIGGANYGTDGQVLTSAGAGAAAAWEDAGGGGGADVQEFTGNGTWTKPSGAKAVLVILQGAGGGGGSGRRGADGDSRGAGSGAGGGMHLEQWIDPDDLGSTEAVAIGAGGSAGAAQTSNTTNGNAGADGGSTTFGSTDAIALGGIKGLGGIAGNVNGGNGGGYAVGSKAGGAGSTGTAGAGDFGGGGGGLGGSQTSANQGGRSAYGGGGGGGGGGVKDSPETEYAGGEGGAGNNKTIATTTAGGGAGGAAGGSNGTAGAASAFKWQGASGGGGGGGDNDGVAGSGAAGGAYGGGGGGGGASENGNNSGAGGAGGAGFCMVITWS